MKKDETKKVGWLDETGRIEQTRPDGFQWLYIATRDIRFRPDRMAVRAELAAHLEDKQADLQRIFPDIPPEEAEQRALESMGDPEEIGRELAKIHKPWLGYLWRVSQVLLVLMLGISLFLWVPRGVREVRWWVDKGHGSTDTFSWYLRGEEPAQTGNSLELGEKPYVERELVLMAQPGVSTQAGDYTLRVDRLALWHGQIRETGKEFNHLYFTLTAWGPPWQKLLYETGMRISGTDNLGNYYYSTYETDELYVEREKDSPFLLTNVMEEGAFSRTFSILAGDVPQGAEWLRLEYDWGGTQWELTIPLKEEGEP